MRSRRRRLRAAFRFVASVMLVSGSLLVGDAAVTLAWQEPLSALLASFDQHRLGQELAVTGQRYTTRRASGGPAAAGALASRLTRETGTGDALGNQLWRNDTPRGGRWRLSPVASAWNADLSISSMGAGLGDLDGNGRLDLVVSDEGPARALFRRHDGFRRALLPAVTRRHPTWGLAVADLDNDGDEDLFAAAGPLGLGDARWRDLLYRGDGRGRFDEVGDRAGVADAGRGRGVAAVDVDSDGRLDLVVTRLGQRPLLYLNRSRTGSAVVLRMRRSSGQADACGAQVRVRAAGRRWLRELDCGSEGLGSASEPLIHVGIGKASRVDSIEIRWPSGRRTEIGARPAGWSATIQEPR